MTIGNTAVAEILCGMGWDWIVIDLEHSAISIDQAQALIQVTQLSGTTPLVRLTTVDEGLIKRVLDAGAEGLIAPMVNSRAQAEAFVRYSRYPPEGSRSVGLARAQGWGRSFGDYVSTFNQRLVLIAQIEHREAIEDIDGIADTPGLDGLMVGPYDLSGSYGVPGEFEDPQVLKALEQIQHSSSRAGLSAGLHVVHPGEDALRAAIAQGYTCIALGTDFIYLREAAESWLAAVREMATTPD
jgi:2-dehydro-3-deoxyglucarate aldolase